MSAPTVESEELLASPSSALGTVAYMSPEQGLAADNAQTHPPIRISSIWKDADPDRILKGSQGQYAHGSS